MPLNKETNNQPTKKKKRKKWKKFQRKGRKTKTKKSHTHAQKDRPCTKRNPDMQKKKPPQA